MKHSRRQYYKFADNIETESSKYAQKGELLDKKKKEEHPFVRCCSAALAGVWPLQPIGVVFWLQYAAPF